MAKCEVMVAVWNFHIKYMYFYLKANKITHAKWWMNDTKQLDEFHSIVLPLITCKRFASKKKTISHSIHHFHLQKKKSICRRKPQTLYTAIAIVWFIVNESSHKYYYLFVSVAVPLNLFHFWVCMLNCNNNEFKRNRKFELFLWFYRTFAPEKSTFFWKPKKSSSFVEFMN